MQKKGQIPNNFALDKLAEESVGFNGAEIEECVNEAMFAAYTENQETPTLQIKHILDAIRNTVPLSMTMKDQIDSLRKWAESRAKPAGKKNEESMSNDKSVPLTKTERELNRSFD